MTHLSLSLFTERNKLSMPSEMFTTLSPVSLVTRTNEGIPSCCSVESRTCVQCNNRFWRCLIIGVGEIIVLVLEGCAACLVIKRRDAELLLIKRNHLKLHVVTSFMQDCCTTCTGLEASSPVAYLLWLNSSYFWLCGSCFKYTDKVSLPSQFFFVY